LLPTISPLFLFTPTSPTDIHTLSLHDALPILVVAQTRAAGNVDFLKVHTSFAVAVHVFAYPSRDPAASVDRVLEMNFRQVAPPARSGLGDHRPVDDNLQPVIRNLRLRYSMDLSYALFSRIETQSGASVVPVHRERQHGTVGDESAPLLQSVDPVLIRELSLNVREHAVRTHRDKGGHLVRSRRGCE